MCYYDNYRFLCSDWKWGNFRQHCQREYRMGETCGTKLAFQIIEIPEKCTICTKIERKQRRLEKHKHDFQRWTKEPEKYRSSLKKAAEEMSRLASEVQQLIQDKKTKSQMVVTCSTSSVDAHSQRGKRRTTPPLRRSSSIDESVAAIKHSQDQLKEPWRDIGRREIHSEESGGCDGRGERSRFRCTVPDCNHSKGFPHQYELDRHVKSEHFLVPATGDLDLYMCAEATCPKHNEVWARRDEFVSHVKAEHPHVHLEDFIATSIGDQDVHTYDVTSAKNTADHKGSPEVSSPSHSPGECAEARGWSRSSADTAPVLVQRVAVRSAQTSEPTIAPSRIGAVSAVNRHGQMPEQPGRAASVAEKDDPLLQGDHSSTGASDGALIKTDVFQATVIVNPIPLAARQQAIYEMLAHEDDAPGATQAVGTRPLRSVPIGRGGHPPRPASAPPIRSHSDKTRRPRRLSYSASTSSSHDSGQALRDGEESGSSSSTGGYLTSSLTQGTSQGHGVHQRSQKGAGDRRNHSTNTPPRHFKKRRTSSSAPPHGKIFPCVYHRFEPTASDPTRYCHIRHKWVSELERHHKCQQHDFLYCTTCFTKFDAAAGYDAHPPSNCQFKCVTEGCPAFGTHPAVRCQHGRGGNSQIGQWRALFRLARPGEQVPDLETLCESTWDNATSAGPSTPLLPPMQTLNGTVAHELQLPASPGLPANSFAAHFDVTGIDQTHATTGLEPFLELSLLRARANELECLARQMWQQVANPDDDRLIALHETYRAAVNSTAWVTTVASRQTGLLEARVRSLDNHVRQLWRHVISANGNRIHLLDDLREMGSSLGLTIGTTLPSSSASTLGPPPTLVGDDVSTVMSTLNGSSSMIEDVWRSRDAMTNWYGEMFADAQTSPSFTAADGHTDLTSDPTPSTAMLQYPGTQHQATTDTQQSMNLRGSVSTTPAGFVSSAHSSRQLLNTQPNAPGPEYFPYTQGDNQAVVDSRLCQGSRTKEMMAHDPTYGTPYTGSFMDPSSFN